MNEYRQDNVTLQMDDATVVHSRLHAPSCYRQHKFGRDFEPDNVTVHG